MDFNKKSLASREQGSPLFTGINAKLESKEDLSVYYSPGIAEPCRVIAKDKDAARQLTIKRNTIAVVSDGSAVLGLGNIGAEAALPVMEGKSMLFKTFADVNAFPIVLNTQDVEEIVESVKRIAPTFGGINLEDISAPRCFEIERRLSEECDIPVFHDDQDGTAMVTTAALKNALRLVNKDKAKVKVVISGAGAAGIAIAKMLTKWGVNIILMVDSKGIVNCFRDDIDTVKREYCTYKEGKIEDAIRSADVFIGVSRGGLVSKEMIESMNRDAIVFALANPEPEIMPEEAIAAGARVVATGRSDYPNQINNVLIFPGFFKGLLDNNIVTISYDMKLKAMEALADLVEEPREDYVIPDAFDERVVSAVADSLKSEA